jgi:alanine dehydrogenase
MFGDRRRQPMSVHLLTRSDVLGLLEPESCAKAIEDAFRSHALGSVPPPAVASVSAADGGFHVKAGVLHRGRSYFVAKVNGNFPGNAQKHALPTIQGVVALCDAETGTPLAVMDSGSITAIRTAAATAVAVQWLARRESRVLALIGCGIQGRAHLSALLPVRPFETVVLCDVDPAAAHALAGALPDVPGLQVELESDPRRAAWRGDVCVTCTPSRRYLLDRSVSHPGMLIAGVGVDHEEKRELAPDLLAGSTVVVDVLEQCATFGDLHHALDARLLQRNDVHATLGEIVAGRKPGRRSDDEVIVFDSTGMALQDAAAAALVYERALSQGPYREIDLLQ